MVGKPDEDELPYTVLSPTLCALVNMEYVAAGKKRNAQPTHCGGAKTNGDGTGYEM
jgi:hypothetical protein